MQLFVSGATRAMAELMPAPGLGYLLTPSKMQRVADIVATGADWAADNECFVGFNPRRYTAMIERLHRGPDGLMNDARRCRFVTVPDSVADHAGTLDLWQDWYPYVAEAGLPAAFVLQDGATSESIPWHQLRCLFIGGTTEYKESAEASALALEARRRGKWVHVGRVSSARRERIFMSLADSIDSSGYSQFARRDIPPALKRLAGYRAHQQYQQRMPV